MESAVWGIIGTAIGALSSIGTTWLTTRTNAKMQIAKLEDERREKAKALQRDTLLSLQEEVHRHSRLQGLAYFEYLKAYSKTREWGNVVLQDNLGEDLRLSQAKVFLLADRVSDEKVRTAVSNLSEMYTAAFFERNANLADELYRQAGMTSTSVLRTIGDALRMTY